MWPKGTHNLRGKCVDRFKACDYIEDSPKPVNNGLVALATLILNTQRNLRTDMQAQRDETKTEFQAQREVIISLLERMAHLEGLLEGLREAITGRHVAEGR